MKRWKKGMAWLLSALCILVTVQIPSIPARAAVSNGQITGISADDAINWVKSNVGNSLGNLVDGKYQCVGLTAQYMKFLGTWFGGSAYEYVDASNAPAGITVIQGAQPQKGDILVYTSSSGQNYFHVAIYADENTTYHQNYYDKQNVTKEGNYLTSKYSSQAYWGVWRPNFKTNQRPVGAVEVVKAVGNKKVRVAGWAYDPDSGVNTPVGLHIYLGTAENQVETYIGKTVTSINRADGYLGYDVILDTPVSGRKYVYVWALDTAGEDNNQMIGSGIVDIPDDTEPPIISNLKVVSKNRNGYTLQCNVSDNVGVAGVEFTTCTEASGKTDWKTYTVTDIVNGVATCEIKTSDFADREGRYYTDVYAYDAAGNKTGWAQENTYYPYIDRTNPGISNVITMKLSDTSYKVSCKVTDDNLQSVQFGTSVNGKLPAWKNVSATDGVYEAVISMDDFSMEEGDYLTTIKAIDTFGNESAMVAELVSLTAKKPLTGIALNKTKMELEKGTTETLTVSYAPVDTTDSKETLWSCSDYSVATVEDGVVTAVGKGNAIITARCGRYTATCNITVTEKNVNPDPEPTEKPLTGITLNKETLELEKGATESLTVHYTPEDTTDNKDVIWTSSEEAVATVTDGTITAVGKGTTIITAKVGNYEASCTVKVTEKEVTPSPVPTETPTPSPTDKPSPTPSEDPSPTPSEDPSPTPSEDPSPTPSEDPSPTPSEDPSPTPSEDPSPTPSEDPSPTPSVSPDPSPSEDPSPTPSVSPDPVPTDKPKPVVKPNVPASGPTSQHTHNFSWVTVQKASTTQDGLEELKCDCGMVKESSVIPASQAYVNELYQNLGKASENGEVSFDSGRIYTISDYLIKKLQERSDVTTTITFEYNRKKYRMIIPAGVDYTELLEDEEYFYGYFYFAKKVGAEIEEL